MLPADSPFFAKQHKVVLANSGLIDPERLEDYVARGGYQALGHALREMTPKRSAIRLCAAVSVGAVAQATQPA